MKNLYKCIETKKANNSRAREAIYRVFLENRDKCLSINDIQKELSKQYSKNISVNTIYRHLDFFVSCNLLIVIQNDFKKSYYSLSSDEALAFLICKKCNRVEKIDFNSKKCDETLEKGEFITIHKKCKMCK